LANFKVGVYDLAILDYKMPDMDGFELYKRMRLVDRNMRVLFISGDHSHFKENELAHPELKPNHFLNKPTSLKVINERIKEILSEKEPSL